jgi:hypothetical protein
VRASELVDALGHVLVHFRGGPLEGLAVAALGFVPPWLAAIGMSVSSLAVVLNTLRIREHTGSRPPATRLRERAA